MHAIADRRTVELRAVDAGRNTIILTLGDICDDTRASRAEKIDAMKDVILAAQMRLRALERGAKSV